MLAARGYAFPQDAAGDFAAVRGDEVVLVLFRDKVGLSEMHSLVEKLKAEALRHCIVVTADKLWSSHASAKAAASGLWIENFTRKQLLVNVSRMHMVPPHVLLTAEEATEFLASEGLVREQLPKISTEDPQARFLGARLDDVVKIFRPSETAGEIIVHRVVAVLPKPKKKQ